MLLSLPASSTIEARNAETLFGFVMIIAQLNMYYAGTPVWEVNPIYTIFKINKKNYLPGKVMANCQKNIVLEKKDSYQNEF